MWIEFNENPRGKKVGDCAVRAISVALGMDWQTAYRTLCNTGLYIGDMPSADAVWGAVLRDNGYIRRSISNYCPDCYTVREFTSEHFKGKYVLATGGHVVCAVDGNYYDSWDSGDEIPLYYYAERKLNDAL